MSRPYTATRTPVSAQHDRPPVSFLDQIIEALNPLPDEVFAVNAAHDIYAVMKGALGPYESLLHRKAVMCEVLRVQAAFESDWDWNEGVDVNNADSLAHIEGEETGAFQVSFNSTNLGNKALLPFAVANNIDTPKKFIAAMKSDHRLAVEYCARLLRVSTVWCGTINDASKVISHVRRDAVAEFQSFLETHDANGGSSAVTPFSASFSAPVASPVVPSTSTGSPAGIPQEVARAFAERTNLGSGCNWIFEVDYSINSRHPRLFVYSISDRTLYKYKCAHGVGGENFSPHDGECREVSNVPNSKCSSLGVIKTAEPYDSDVVGEALRLDGLSPTNSKIRSRGIVLHGGAYVSDNAANSDTSISGRSHGCIVVDDRYIDPQTGGELIEWLKGGSVGVAHYSGRFNI